MDEQVAILERRLTSKELPPASTLLDRTIDSIETILANPNDVTEGNVLITSSSHQFEKMNQMKHDLIHQSILAGRETIATYMKTILAEKQKCSFNKNINDSWSDIQVAVINAIETRRLHMIERAKYITQQKLATYFKYN